jgi:peptide/nickel transport system substrate-binding protein
LASGTGEIPLTVELIGAGLRGCGIGVDIQLLPPAELLKSGPEGPIFGRKFDLAFFSWAPGHYQRCRLFTTDEIPGLYPEYAKGWGGVNATGYSNEDFDLACGLVNTNLPDSAETLLALEQLSSVYRTDLPSLPLFFRNAIIVSTPNLIGLENGIYSQFWNMEYFR